MKNLVKYMIPAFLLPMGFMSCLKDSPTVDPKESNNVVEFANTYDNLSNANSHYPRYNIDLGTLAAGDSAQIPINLSYSGADMAPQDITVTLEVDTAALNTFNEDNGTDYVAPPADIYNFPATAVIKKGTQVIQINAAITLNSSYDFGVSYALPLRIVSASTGVISGNFGAALYSFGARNEYDGNYELRGTTNHATNPGLAGPVGPTTMPLVTNTANSIKLGKAHPWANGSGSSLPGGYEPIYTINADNTVTITNNSVTAEVVPGSANHYDPATKTIYAAWQYAGSGGYRTFYDTLTYKSPR